MAGPAVSVGVIVVGLPMRSDSLGMIQQRVPALAAMATTTRIASIQLAAVTVTKVMRSAGG